MAVLHIYRQSQQLCFRNSENHRLSDALSGNSLEISFDTFSMAKNPQWFEHYGASTLLQSLADHKPAKNRCILPPRSSIVERGHDMSDCMQLDLLMTAETRILILILCFSRKVLLHSENQHGRLMLCPFRCAHLQNRGLHRLLQDYTEVCEISVKFRAYL